jgi:hypothetical protein
MLLAGCSSGIAIAVLFPAFVGCVMPSLIHAALVVVAVFDGDAAEIRHVADKSFITDAHFFADFSAHSIGVHVRVAGVTFLFAFAATVCPDFIR